MAQLQQFVNRHFQRVLQQVAGLVFDECTEGVRGGARVSRRALEPLGDTRPALFQQREQFEPQVIAIEPCVLVGGIFQPADIPFFQKPHQVSAPNIEKRTRHPARLKVADFRDASQALDSATAHQVQEQGFGLVLCVVRGQVEFFRPDNARNGPVTGIARRFL